MMVPAVECLALAEWRLALADACAILGAAAMTLSIAGLLRFPDTYAKLHAAGVALVPGTVLVLAASLFSCGLDTIARAALTGAFLLLTAPVASHALARLELHLRRARAPSAGGGSSDERRRADPPAEG